MVFKFTGVDKSLLANFAGIWIYSRMSVNVNIQRRPIVELFLAKFAFKTFAGVNATNVIAQCNGIREAALALGTSKWAFPSMCSHVRYLTL